MQIAEQIPEVKIKIDWRRRALGIFTGLALLSIAAFYIFLLVEFTTSAMVLDPNVYSDPCRLFVRTRNVAILVGIVYLGLNLLAKPKRPVLFLRRFGLDVNSTVSRVVRKGLGRQFRFVTLDDGRFPAVDIPALERWTTRLAPLVIAVIVVLGALAARNSFSHQYSSNGAYAQTATQMNLVMGYWTAICWTLLMLAWVHSLQMRRKSRYQIRNDGQLNAFLFDISRLGRWRLRLSLLRPQAVVAKVNDALWQQCVSAVSEQFGIVLIDVSEPTPNLRWEIEESRRVALQCVFIAEKSRLRAWIGDCQQPPLATATGSNAIRETLPDILTDVSGSAGGAGESVVQLVGDDCVLLYHGDQKLGGPSFQRSLQQLLCKASGQMARRSRAKRFPLVDHLWRISLAIVFHAFVVLVAMASGLLIAMVVISKSATD